MPPFWRVCDGAPTIFFPVFAIGPSGRRHYQRAGEERHAGSRHQRYVLDLHHDLISRARAIRCSTLAEAKVKFGAGDSVVRKRDMHRPRGFARLLTVLTMTAQA